MKRMWFAGAVFCLLAGKAVHAELYVGASYSTGYGGHESSALSVRYSNVSDVSFFYGELAPHGAWLNVEPYGMVWQPTEVRADPMWRPYYCGGQWVWTSLGWYWDSSYAWGWAPFHYGRWMLLPDYRWVWIPDCTWGPAWVSWRYAPSYCGWAPLPPGAVYRAGAGFSYYSERVSLGFHWNLTDESYVFVPSGYMCASDLTVCAVPRPRSREIYHAAAAPANPYGYKDSYVVNYGPPKEIFSSSLSKPIGVAPLVFNGKGGGVLSPPFAVSPITAGKPAFPMNAAPQNAFLPGGEAQSKWSTPPPLGAPAIRHGTTFSGSGVGVKAMQMPPSGIVPHNVVPSASSRPAFKGSLSAPPPVPRAPIQSQPRSWASSGGGQKPAPSFPQPSSPTMRSPGSYGGSGGKNAQPSTEFRPQGVGPSIAPQAPPTMRPSTPPPGVRGTGAFGGSAPGGASFGSKPTGFPSTAVPPPGLK